MVENKVITEKKPKNGRFISNGNALEVRRQSVKEGQRLRK